MFKSIRSNIFFLFIVLSSFLFAKTYADSPQYENKIIEKITVIVSPGTEIQESGVKTRLKTKEGDHFSQTEFDNDLKNLIKDFDRIIPEITLADQKIYITLQISLKPKIHTIYWTGNEKMKTKALEKELGIGNGTTFDRQVFNKAFHKLKAFYVKEGFFEAELNYEVALNPLCNEVNIEISIAEGRAGRIKKILFCGLDSCDQNEITELMVTKHYNFFTSWVTNEGTYNEDAIQQDQFVILNYLQNRGYADAKVNITVSEANEKNRIILCVNVDKGAVYSVGDVTFSGNTLFCDEDIAKRFTVRAGCAYSPEAIRNTIDAITKLYGKFGYIDAYVDYEPKLECDAFVYSLQFTIHEGEQFRVGLIKVLGNCTTETNVILHETLLIPGQVFNSEKLEATESRLKNVGFFKNVNVYAVKSEGLACLGENYRDVHVELEETSTGHFGASFGFSTTESIFGGINVTENNFNYKGLNRIFTDGLKAVRGGGEYAHITATVGKKSRSYILSWTKPYFMDTEWSIGFDMENSSTRYISKNYEINANSFTMHATNQINPFVRLGYHYRIRNSVVHVNKHVKETERNQLHHDGLISALGVNLLYDSTDHPLRPTKGFKSRFESELAGFGGDYQFFVVAYLNSYYIQTDKDGVLKFRGDTKFVQPMFGTAGYKLPVDERLFLGGDYTIRGYRPYKVGPRFKGSKDPEGALSLQYLSVEYSRRILKRLDGFLFLDSGHASLHNWGFGTMRTAVGFGVRFQVFEAGPPLQMGMGFPLNPKGRSEVKKFFLTVGGKF